MWWLRSLQNILVFIRGLHWLCLWKFIKIKCSRCYSSSCCCCCWLDAWIGYIFCLELNRASRPTSEKRFLTLSTKTLQNKILLLLLLIGRLTLGEHWMFCGKIIMLGAVLSVIGVLAPCPIQPSHQWCNINHYTCMMIMSGLQRFRCSVSGKTRWVVFQ